MFKIWVYQLLYWPAADTNSLFLDYLFLVIFIYFLYFLYL
jgi:hypothetical protein